jgi:hypothetical protein
MSVLSELHTIIDNNHIPVETGVFSGIPPDEYIVITPLTEIFPIFGDDKPLINLPEYRLSLFSKGNYNKTKNTLTAALINGGFTITERRYNGYDNETGYHGFTIDVQKVEEIEWQRQD